MTERHEAAFRKEIGNHQDPPDEVSADGKIHRYGPKKVLWYVMFPDGIPAGAFGDWRKQDQQHKWCAKDASKLTKSELTANIKRMEETKRLRDKEQREEHERVKEEAKSILESAGPADPDHGYLKRKGIKPHNLRQNQRDGLGCASCGG